MSSTEMYCASHIGACVTLGRQERMQTDAMPDLWSADVIVLQTIHVIRVSTALSPIVNYNFWIVLYEWRRLPFLSSI